MMRYIKFRAWDKVSKHWIDNDDYVIYPDDGGVGETNYYEIVDENHDALLEQFTGLNDKNGKEIYEGDIIRCVAHGSNKIFVKWVAYYSEQAMFCLYSNKEKPRGMVVAYYDLEVIGNIHENKELLDE